MDKLKIKYNKLLKRIEKADEWFNLPETTLEQQEKHLPAFEKLLKEITEVTLQIQETQEISRQEIREGFKS